MKITQKVKKILSHYECDNVGTKTNLARILMSGKLAGTGKMIILPVDQGFEHGPARSFAMNPDAYDPHYHFQLAIDAGLNAYRILKGLAPQDSNQLNQPRIPAANNSNNRAVSAAVSVRGRNAPHIAQIALDDDEEVPANETPAQSVQRAMAQIARG